MFKKVVLAVDGSDYSQKAVPLAVELAKLSGGELVVLHVREHEVSRGATWDRETEEEAKAIVDQATATAKQAGVKATGELRRALLGRVAPTILDTAKDAGADVVVMGSRGLSDIGGLLLGSVTHKVIQLSDRPVLVAR